MTTHRSEYDQAMQEAQADAEKVRRGECPDCGAAMELTRDKRQQGETEVAGDWHHARCACGYFCDVVIDAN